MHARVRHVAGETIWITRCRDLSNNDVITFVQCWIFIMYERQVILPAFLYIYIYISYSIYQLFVLKLNYFTHGFRPNPFCRRKLEIKVIDFPYTLILRVRLSPRKCFLNFWAWFTLCFLIWHCMLIIVVASGAISQALYGPPDTLMICLMWVQNVSAWLTTHI